MSGWKRALLWGALLTVLVFTLAYAVLFLLVSSGRFQHWLTAEISKKSGFEVNLGDLRLVPPLRLVASAVAVSKSARNILQSDRIDLTLSPIDLFSRSIYRLQIKSPRVYLDIHELFEPSSKRSFEITIRRLNIDSGTIVLRTSEANHLEFHSVTMDADNFTVGGATGLNLRSDLPWLNARAEIAFHGEDNEKIVGIIIRQTSAKKDNLGVARKTSPDAIRAEVKLRKKETGDLQILATGQVDQLVMNKQDWSGRFDVNANIDAALKTIVLSGNADAAALPSGVSMISPLFGEGPVSSIFEGNYSIAQKQLELKSLRLKSRTAVAEGAGDVDFNRQLSFSKTRFKLRNISNDTLKQLLPQWLGVWTYNGATEADVELNGAWPAVVVSGVLRSEGSNWKNEKISLEKISVNAPFAWRNGSLRCDDVQIAGKTLIFDQNDKTRISAEEILFSGGLENAGSSPLRSRGKLEIRRGRFATADGSKVGENLALTVRFGATTTADKNIISAVGKLDVEQAEVLWGTFFGDFKNYRPALDFDGDYFISENKFGFRRLHLSMLNIGTIALSGTVARSKESPNINVALQSADFKPSGFFEFFIRDTFKKSYPFLDQLLIDGRMSFSARAQGPLRTLSTTGVLQLQGGTVSGKAKNWQIGPIRLTLPFEIYLPSGKADSATAKIQPGTLVIDSARFRSESIPTVRTVVALRNNSLKFEQPIQIGIYGGTIEIINLSWKDVIAHPEAMSFSLNTKNLELERLTAALDWYRFSGTISGSIPRVEWSGTSLRSEGQIQAQLFGGRVQISKTEIENPFSPVPSIKLDCRFQDIDLDKASQTFEFGRISGIVEGSVTDLVLSNGQASQFVADVHSVERSGTSQWISVEALNKITVLSSGNNAGTLYGGLSRLFDNFRYSKLGFKATLKNDKLTLRGIESRDGKEYLVVGSFLPPTVNVISYTQEISFSELMRRLKQIQKSDKPQIG